VRRADLEHIIRAAGSIADAQKLVIIGSQAILGSFPNAPAELTISAEADTYPLDAPEKADLIDGSIGEKSPFHETFGYYAHGVGPETAVLPANWQARLVPVQNENTRGVVGLCLSAGDLAISKLAAGREKDLKFVTAMLERGLISAEAIQALFDELDEAQLQLIRPRLECCRVSAGR
jgi:hypothetical protein